VTAVAALAAVQLVVVVDVAFAYGTDGVLATIAAVLLAPVAVWAVHGIGRRVAGETFAVGAAATFVALPLVGRAYFEPAYDDLYAHRVLPELVGLRSTWWYALGIALALVVRVAPRAAVAAGGVAAAATAIVAWGLDPVADLKPALHETGWSIALLEWLPLAGLLGAARRSPSIAVGLFGWLAFFVLRAATDDYASGAFWRGLAPALPAAAVLTASVALLVPALRPARKAPQTDAP
jgi:hypothetical protein